MIWSNLERISGWATEQRSGGAEDAVKTSPSSSRCPHRSSAIRRHCGSVRQVSAAAAVETGSLGA